MAQGQLFISISVNDLEAIIKKSVLEVLENTQSRPQPEEDGFLTREETAKHLHISKGTLDTYTKEGLIKAEKLGNRVLYRKSDINEALSEKINLLKHKSK